MLKKLSKRNAYLIGVAVVASISVATFLLCRNVSKAWKGYGDELYDEDWYEY